MRHKVLRDLAMQSLEATRDLEQFVELELVETAGRENITVFELMRERLLLKAGVSTIDALAFLVERLTRVPVSTIDPKRNLRDTSDVAA